LFTLSVIKVFTFIKYKHYKGYILRVILWNMKGIVPVPSRDASFLATYYFLIYELKIYLRTL